jgi:hypothetical protein
MRIGMDTAMSATSWGVGNGVYGAYSLPGDYAQIMYDNQRSKGLPGMSIMIDAQIPGGIQVPCGW